MHLVLALVLVHEFINRRNINAKSVAAAVTHLPALYEH